MANTKTVSSVASIELIAYPINYGCENTRSRLGRRADRREDRSTLLNLNYGSSFGRTDGDQNVNRHIGEVLFLAFLPKRWFVAPAFGQLLNDRFQNIKFRATPGTGAGVHIIDVPNVKWDFLTGVGYQYLNYLDATQFTDGNPQNDAFIPFYTYADFNITGDIELTASWLTNHTGKADLSMIALLQKYS
jgi:hypothetical protein